MTGYVRELALAARAAQRQIATCSAVQRQALLEAMAVQLLDSQASILVANAQDMGQAAANGASKATLDRLLLDPARIAGMASALREVARRPIRWAR